MGAIQFTKMEGTNNDFVVLDGINNQIVNESFLAQILCHRKKGVGADQLVVLKSCQEKIADFTMHSYNPDGTQVEICGNALRALALYIYKNKFSDKKNLTIETVAGVKNIQINSHNNCTVNMKKPSFKAQDIGLTETKSNIEILDKKFDIHCVSMGNPHCVIILESDPAKFPVEVYGPLIENLSLFRNKTNVEFIQKIGTNHIKMRVWERGVGITDSCGSGACASAVISIQEKLCNPSNPITVSLPGGDLLIEWRNKEEVLMTGNATTIFEGEFQID